MPLLKAMHLEHILASPELIDVLVGHKDTLEELTLRNCYASLRGLTKYGIYWSQLFTSLFSAYCNGVEIRPSPVGGLQSPRPR